MAPLTSKAAVAGTSAPRSEPRPTRTSARVAIQTEESVPDKAGEIGGKGKKRASAATSTEEAEPRVTRRRVSAAAEEGAKTAAPRRNKSRASKGGEAEESAAPEASAAAPASSRSKKGKGRSSGVTRFWRNNSSIAGKSEAPSKKKDFMSAGIYCQDPDPNSPRKLVNRVLSRRHAELTAARKKGRAAALAANGAGNDEERPVFPPMPYDFGETHFFEQQHEFVLPYDIQWEAENGTLDAKKRPDAYQRIRQNAFPERTKVGSDVTAICRCTPESGCNENCDNRIMHYTCGKNCPAGEMCGNKSLWKRKQPPLKVAFTGSRGFGLFATQDINEGDFVIDYRGEVIALSTFYERCNAEYAASKNYYALAYDQDEVIDAAAKGNEARFINHGCQSNLEVRKVSTLGEGVEEFEVGMWASRDIAAGEELCYDYNFDSFAAATATECRCGAPNCIGYLGRNPGEKTGREKALEADLNASTKKAIKKQVKRAVKTAASKASVKKVASPAKARKSGKAAGKGREKAAEQERDKRAKMRQLREMRAFRAAEVAADAAVQGGQTSAQGAMMPPSFDGTPFLQPDATEAAATAVTQPKKKRGKAIEQKFDGTEIPPPRKVRGKAGAGGSKKAGSAGAGSDAEDEAARKEEARKRRISGWADWLKKKASEKSRTRAEWQEFANKRRRGKAWMEGMMQEYGVAAYEGGPAEPYTSPLVDIPPTGQPKKRGPPPGTPRAPRLPKTEAPAGPRVFDPLLDAAVDGTLINETDAERALRSIYPDFALPSEIPNLGESSGTQHDEPAPIDQIYAAAAAVDQAAGQDGFDGGVDYDTLAVENLFGPSSVDYFETTQQQFGMASSSRLGNSNQLSQQSNARTEPSVPVIPYSLAQVPQDIEMEEMQAEADPTPEQVRQRAMAIVSSIQPQMPPA